MSEMSDEKKQIERCINKMTRGRDSTSLNHLSTTRLRESLPSENREGTGKGRKAKDNEKGRGAEKGREREELH